MKQKLLLFLGCMLMVMGMRAEESVTLSFANAEQRISQDTKQQTWKNGCITFINEKASSSTSVADYTDPVRLYKGSSISIKAESPMIMNKIVFCSNGTSQYKTALENSLKESGYEFTNSGNNYTVTLSPATAEFKIEELTAQARLVSLTVYYVENNEEVTPGVPETPTLTPSCSFLETQKVEISCSSDGVTIYYTTDGSDPTKEDEVYSSPLEITTTTTVKAIAVNGNGASDIAEATYTKVEAMSIAGAKEAYDKAGNAQVFINLENAVVTVNKGDYLFIQDKTTGINLYKSGASYAVGTQFTQGILSGTSTAYNKMHQITNSEFTDVETTTVEVAPIAVTVAQLNADYATYEGRYVKLADVKLAGTTITQGEDSYIAYDRFGIGFASQYPTATTCDIEGIVACYGATLQIFPVVITVKEAVLPEVSPAGGEDAENALTIEQGAKITITPAENNIVNYSINDAEGIAITEATTITAENLGEMELVVTSTFGSSSKTATYYYNVVAETPKVTATLTTGEINDAANVGSYSETASVRSKTGVWSGYMMVNKSGGYLQINSNTKGYHIQSPVFPGRVMSVAITFNSEKSTASRTFVVMPSKYGGTTANESSDGCLGAATYDGTSETVTATLSGDVNSFKIFSKSGAIYISSVQVVYEKPADYVLSIGSTGWASLYLGLDAKIPEGVTCYRVTAVENGVATLKETRVVNGETAGLPAHTAVIVKGEPNTDYTFEYKNSYAYSIVSGNLLKGTIEDKDITAEDGMAYYVLAKPENAEVGLYKATINQADGKAFKNNANKAYLPISVSSSTQSNGYRFNIEGTTAIAPSIFDTPQSAAIYDLTGRRVEKMEKGIYIVNGKKVIR